MSRTGSFWQSVSLHVISSNRFEALLASLVSALLLPERSPFAPDRIVVPTMGVRRRIELTAADTLGVCANVEFSFLAQWLWAQIAKVVPDVAESSPFAPPRLAWRIFRILGEPEFTGAHLPLARYLARDDASARYELALRIASLFDHYITYRQDWLARWSVGQTIEVPAAAAFEHEPWQAALWRRVTEELGASRQHPSVAFFSAIRSGRVDARAVGLPDVAHVFCLPSMPPLYVDMLRELARWTELYVYVLNPSEAYWHEIVTPRRLAELEATRRADHHEIGNRLLAQWGMQAKANLEVTLEAWQDAAIEDSAYGRNAADTMLAQLQNAMLDLREIEPASLAATSTDDRSIEVHACHSLTRQLEVLHDQLLAMFEADSSLQPRDVVVVTPQLEDAAPLIDAVFGNASAIRAIPYTITGRGRSTVNVAARALLDIVALATSRFPASGFVEAMQHPMVARRFDLDRTDLEALREWIRAAGIRWGLDAQHRAALGLPAVERHTFDDGLRRLLLGYALPRAARTPVEQWLPAGDPEGQLATALGSLARALDALGDLRDELATPRTPEQWLRTLLGVFDTFFAPMAEAVDDVREVRDALRALYADMNAGAGAVRVPVDVVRRALEAILDDPARGGVPSGGVTFASMTSLRSLPYRIVCAIGLDQGVFPGLDRPLEFDLIAAAPRRGDRQRRTEDRNVFLDLLLAARERLYLSYTGRDIRDNSVRPPSAVVDELLDVLVPALAADVHDDSALAAARERLVVKHPLQPFSLAYFRPEPGSRRRSFNEEYHDALKARLAAPLVAPGTAVVPEDPDVLLREPALAFFAEPLAPPSEEWRVVGLEQLKRFFRNPCDYLLRQRLEIRLPEAEEEIEDDEPFVVTFDARDALATRLMPVLLDGIDDASALALAEAGIEYPAGDYGRGVLQAEMARMHAFARGVRAELTPAVLAPATGNVVCKVHGAIWRLEGSLADLRPEGLMRWRYDDARARDYLDGWIEHLFMNALALPGVGNVTTWRSRDGVYRLRPMREAVAQLQVLMALYAEGLQRPLHFFRRSSWCYAPKHSLGAAQSAWRSTTFRVGEDSHPAYRLCLRGVVEPLDEEFEACADAVFGPMREVLEDARVEWGT